MTSPLVINLARPRRLGPAGENYDLRRNVVNFSSGPAFGNPPHIRSQFKLTLPVFVQE